MEIPDLHDLVLEFLHENHIKADPAIGAASSAGQIWIYRRVDNRHELACVLYTKETQIVLEKPGQSYKPTIIKINVADPNSLSQLLRTLENLGVSHYPPDKE